MEAWERWWFDSQGFVSSAFVWLLKFAVAFVFLEALTLYLLLVPGLEDLLLMPLLWLFVAIFLVKVVGSLSRRARHVKVSVWLEGGAQAYRVSSTEEKIQIQIEQRHQPMEMVVCGAPRLRGFCQESDFTPWSRVYAIKHDGERDRHVALLQDVPVAHAKELVRWLAAKTHSSVLRGQD